MCVCDLARLVRSVCVQRLGALAFVCCNHSTLAIVAAKSVLRTSMKFAVQEFEQYELDPAIAAEGVDIAFSMKECKVPVLSRLSLMFPLVNIDQFFTLFICFTIGGRRCCHFARVLVWVWRRFPSSSTRRACLSCFPHKVCRQALLPACTPSLLLFTVFVFLLGTQGCPPRPSTQTWCWPPFKMHGRLRVTALACLTRHESVPLSPSAHRFPGSWRRQRWCPC